MYINVYNNISLDFLKVSSLNEELQKRAKQLALANNEVITSLRVFDYCDELPCTLDFSSELQFLSLCSFWLVESLLTMHVI